MDEALISRIEDAGLNASAPPQQRWLDGWLLRYLPGKARRARCINALAPGVMPLQRKLTLAAEVYAEAGLPMIFRLSRFSQPASLDAGLDGMGWARIDSTHVMLRAVQPLRPAPALPEGLCWQTLAASEFAQVVGALRDSPPAHQQAHALRLQHSPVPYQGFALQRVDDGQVLACGQTAREADLVGIYDVHTHESARGRGLAGLLCERMLSHAAADGAGTAYLQVASDNLAAISVYRRMGFAPAYDYHYREQA